MIKLSKSAMKDLPCSVPDWQSLLDGLAPLIREAGNMAVTSFGRSRILDNKSGGDLTTDIDLRINRYLITGLKRLLPAAGILSEESGCAGKEQELTWILDPIDGSKHYARGIPWYAISAALQQNNEFVLGVIGVPVTGELFAAVKGGGATRNNIPISCSQTQNISQAILCIELPSRHGGHSSLQRALNQLQTLMMACQRIRVIGVSTLGLCYCAMGAFDAYVNLGSAPNAIWDTAAGEIIAREAGCLLSHDSGLTVVSPPKLYQQILDQLESIAGPMS
ncbi:MAG TPA: inositol monophosphatase family protein [bacterium]|nr:inositol monophosphatase family protein [bacterium]